MMDVRHRLSTVVVVSVCLFGTLFARLTYLQVVEGKSLEAQAEKNLIQTVIVPAPRGRIFDRDNQLLVDNRTVATVSLVKAQLPKASQRPDLYARLSGVLGIPAEEIARRFDAIDNLEGVEIARGVTESALIYLAEHAEEFPGVKTALDAQRVYPRGTMSAHVLGYVSDIGDDLKEPPCQARYQTGDKIGKAGVEREYECELRGLPGVSELTVDRKNNIQKVRVLSEPIPGIDIRLTIDPELQEISEKALDSGMRAARAQRGFIYRGNSKKEQAEGVKQFRANAAAVVVIDSTNGATLASVSRPLYDPSDFVRGLPQSEFDVKYGGERAGSPLTDRVIAGRYAPGSTFKLITAVSALNNGLITTKTTIEDNGQFDLPECRSQSESKKTKGFRCTFYNAGRTPHGKVDLRRSLVVSSDVFYYRLGYKFWNGPRAFREGIQETAREFGFGGETGIALPNEKSSPVPDVANKLARHESNPDVWPDGQWRTGDTINLSIGQGEMEATPLQIAMAYAAFANGGTLYVPRVAFDTPPPPVPDTTPAGATTTTKPGAPQPLPTLSTVPGSTLPGSTLPGSTLPGSTLPGSTLIPGLPTSISEALAPLGFASGRFGPYLPDLITEWPSQGDDSTETGVDTTLDPNLDSTENPGEVPGETLPGGDSVPDGGLASDTTLPVLTPIDGAELTPIPVRVVDLSSDVRDPVMSGFRGVVMDKEGTANPAFEGFDFTAFPIAGKTGTAQNLGKQDNALFVGMGGPNYRYIVVVVMEQSGYGGQAAAPVARQIFNALAGRQVDEVRYQTEAVQG